jgi:hypothetical protein
MGKFEELDIVRLVKPVKLKSEIEEKWYTINTDKLGTVIVANKRISGGMVEFEVVPWNEDEDAEAYDVCIGDFSDDDLILVERR